MSESNKATILYLEDDMGSQRLVQRVLESRGYHVFIANNGATGIELAKRERPQLILMDINLPGMNGKEITTRLRSISNFAHVPIVALTANTSPGNREQALAAGCTGFMTKPIDVSTFPKEIADYLSGRRESLSDQEKNLQLELYAQQLVTRLENKIQELEDANQRLRELDRMKSDFIALVSHELRTPLTLVSGYSYLLLDKAREAEQEGYPQLVPVVDGLNKGIHRLGQVVGEIINVARIASGSLDLAVGPVRLSEVIGKILEEQAAVHQSRTLKFDVDDLTELPLVQGDGGHLKVALENVIGNAIKYTPDNGTITILGELAGDAIHLTIKDTGVGIPMAEQKRIFEQFHILGSIKHHSTSKSAFQGGGLGLGLPIAKGIIEAHNGRIWVESKPEDKEAQPGSTFHILLPVQQPR